MNLLWTRWYRVIIVERRCKKGINKNKNNNNINELLKLFLSDCMHALSSNERRKMKIEQ